MRLEIDGAKAGIKFSASHFIPGHPKCGRLHGHSYSVKLVLHGEKGDRGMVLDFLPVKKALKEIADEFDHRVIVAGGNPQIKLKLGKEVEVTTKGKRYVFPADDVVVIDTVESSAEELADLILQMFLERMKLPDNVSEIDVGVYEEQGQGAWASRKLR